MKYTPSINIEQSSFERQNYIVTQNALGVVGKIVSSFNTGIHSFNIIGSYGTGKSNFLLALEHSLVNESQILYRTMASLMDFINFVSIRLLVTMHLCILS